MKHIFYLFGIFFILHELHWLFAPVKLTKKRAEWHRLYEEHKGVDIDDWSEEYTVANLSKIPMLLLTVWMFLGLLTFNWPAFLMMILFSLLILSPLSKLTRFSTSYTVIHWLASAIGFVWGVFVILNSYHFKIDLWPYIKGLF